MTSPLPRVPFEAVTVDGFMSRIRSCVHASAHASSSAPSSAPSSASSSSADLDLTEVSLLFEGVSHDQDTDTNAWILAMILRYCDDVLRTGPRGQETLPECAVFGRAVTGFSRLFSQGRTGFQFFDQVDTAVSWACWTAWCMRDRSAGRIQHVLCRRLRCRHAKETGSALLYAMVLTHVPCPEAGFDECLCLLMGAVRLLEGQSSSASYYAAYYASRVAQRCVATAGEVHATTEQQMRMLSALREEASRGMDSSGRLEEFLLAMASAITHEGTRYLCPEACLEVLCILSACTRRMQRAYIVLLRSLMDVYRSVPAYAEMVLDRSKTQAHVDDRTLLSVLLPACHALSSSIVVRTLGPRCVELLRDCTVSDSRMLGLVNDVFCSMFTHPGLSPDEVLSLGTAYLRAFPRDSAGISEGVEALCLVHDGALQQDVLDVVLERARDNSEAFGAGIRALSLLPLQDVPRLCDRLHEIVTGSPPPSRMDRMVQLKAFIDKVTDITRRAYLVEWYCDL